MNNEVNKKGTNTTIIKRSITLFVFRVILLELFFELIYLTWRTLVHFFPFSIETTISLNIVSIIFFIILITIIQNIILIYIALRWANNYYELKEDEVIQITGIISKTKKAYPVSDIQSITLQQGFMGRLFNYGNISFYIPTLGHDLNFNEVSDPQEFIELIKNAQPKDSTGKFVFKR